MSRDNCLVTSYNFLFLERLFLPFMATSLSQFIYWHGLPKWAGKKSKKLFTYFSYYKGITTGNSRLKLHAAFRCCPQWVLFFKVVIHQKQCKFAVKLGVTQITNIKLIFFLPIHVIGTYEIVRTGLERAQKKYH